MQKTMTEITRNASQNVQEFNTPIPPYFGAVNFDLTQANPNTGNIASFSLSVIPVLQESLIDPGSSPFFYLTPTNDLVKLSSTDPIGEVLAADGNDFVVGSVNSDRIFGNAGNDTLFGFEGGSIEDEGTTGDSLYGGKDNDVLSGGPGSDVLVGERGDDYLFGNDGNDLLQGGKGKDALIGNAGNDILIGGNDVDRMWGGGDRDFFVLARSQAAPLQSYGYDSIPADIANAYQPVPADIILDYNPEEDAIGLTGGLTNRDVILYQKYIVLGDRRDYDPSGPYPLDSIRTDDFQTEVTLATIITEGSTGNILGIVRGVAPNLLTITAVGDGILNLGTFVPGQTTTEATTTI
jgi:Ca2+-binding RTX toxin-like protein